jgi:RloB-like protein
MVHVDEFNGTPMALVERAIARKNDEAREERRGGGPAHDEVWCVFDVDQHPYLKDAISLAERNGIKIAVSNPCFELWLILHYEDQNAYIEPRLAQARALELVKCKKVLTEATLEALVPLYEDAAERARTLDSKHEGDGNEPRSNPSSEVWKLVDQVVHPDGAS